MSSSEEAVVQPRRYRAYIGLAFSLVSAFFSALSGLMITFIATQDTNMTILIRMCVQYFWLIPHLTYRNEGFVLTDLKINLLLLARTFCSLSAIWLLLFSLTLAPLGDVIAVHYSYVILVGFFACVCLKESCGILEVILSGVNLIGLVLVARPSFLLHHESDASSLERTLGIIASFASAIFTACSVVIVRKIGRGVHYSLSIFYFTWMAIIAVVIYISASDGFYIPCLQDLLLMVAHSFAAFVSQILMILSLQYEKAGPVTLVNMSQVIFAFILQFAFVEFDTTWYSMLGAAMIFACGVILILRNIKNG